MLMKALETGFSEKEAKKKLENDAVQLGLLSIILGFCLFGAVVGLFALGFSYEDRGQKIRNLDWEIRTLESDLKSAQTDDTAHYSAMESCREEVKQSEKDSDYWYRKYMAR